jgi:flagellar hook-associated protein 1 FlgK
VLAGGTDYLRLGFANDYRFPDVLADEAPADFISPNDERTLLSKVRSDLGLFEKLQFNTLFSGENARDIGVDPTITAPELVRAGLSLGSGDNRLALAMVELQNALVIGGNQFSIDESYGNLVGKLGTDVRKHDSLSTNEGLQLQGFIAERDRISGVDLDEELVNMMLFQRAYESNARMFSTFNQMIEELLKL